MKILYVITKSNWGGAQKYVFDLANAFKDTHSVVVAFGGTGERNAASGLLAQKLHESGLRTILIPSLERNIAWLAEFKVLFDLISLFRKEKPDVVHLNSSKVGGTGALAARITGVPKIIYTAHGWAFGESRSFAKRAAIKIASWFTIIFSKQVVVITQRDFNAIASWPFARKKLVLIYNGINPDFKVEQNSDIRSAFPVGSVIVGTIGELHKNKNQIALIEAAKSLPENICFAIVGEGEERKKLETAIAKLDLENRVKLFGFMSAARALPNFDIFALPSTKEGLPYVILEAGLASLLVIATNVGGIPEIIEHEKTGILFSPQDTQGIASSIKLLSEKHGGALKQKILEKFSLAKMLSETRKIYLEKRIGVV